MSEKKPEITIIKIPSEEAKVVDIPHVKPNERWTVQVEFTFPVEAQDITTKFEGDAEIDFQRRAFERLLRPQLEKLVREGGEVTGNKADWGYFVLSKTMRRY